MKYEILNIDSNEVCSVAYLDLILKCEGFFWCEDIAQKQLAVEYYGDYDCARFMWLLMTEDGFLLDSVDAEDIDEDITPYEEMLREEFEC